MIKINSHTVSEATEKVRLLDYTIGLFIQLPSRNSVKKAIKRGELRLNGQRADQGRWINNGDLIELYDSEQKAPKEFELELDVFYEDEHLAIINKPAGILVSGNKFRTIENALVGNITPSPETDALKWPKPVHRLDHQTSGLLIIAKTRSAHMHLGQMFEHKHIQKTYRAVVKGLPKEQGEINIPIEEHHAYTDYKTLKTVPSIKNSSVSLVELRPRTGRTHQLRIHMAAIGHPIIGDKVHDNADETVRHKGLFLAAISLEFQHPITNEKIKIEMDMPNKFSSYMNRELKRWEKYNK